MENKHYILLGTYQDGYTWLCFEGEGDRDDDDYYFKKVPTRTLQEVEASKKRLSDLYPEYTYTIVSVGEASYA